MTAPGIHTITAADYHADKIADQPSLSSSIAHLLCSASPAHARAAHPRLNPDYQPREEHHFDIGTIAHSLLLDDSADVALVEADDWRTKAAREARDEARAAGRIPLLTKHWAAVEAITRAALDQLIDHDATPTLLTAGKPEQTLVWEEWGGVICRARCDWLRDDHQAIDDLKTTARTANPEAFSRSLYSMGYDVQTAFYLRGLRALTGVDAVWRWIVVETQPPYALSVVSPGPAVLFLADTKVEKAISLWRRCLSADSWPGYPARVCWAELPAWEEGRWMEKEAREEVAA